MIGMFYNSQFSGDLSRWNTNNVADVSYMFDYSPLEGKEPKWHRTRPKWFV